MAEHAVEVMLKRRGWVKQRDQTGYAVWIWHKRGTGLWIQSKGKLAWRILAGSGKPLYRITEYNQNNASLKECGFAVGLAMNFAEGIAPLADWPNAGQWTATKELGEQIKEIGYKVLSMTEAEYKKFLNDRAEEMVQVFVAAAKAAPDPGEGAGPDELMKLLLSAVQERFPGATEDDSERMLAKLHRRKWLKSMKLPIMERMNKGLVLKVVTDIATTILDEEVAAGRCVPGSTITPARSGSSRSNKSRGDGNDRCAAEEASCTSLMSAIAVTPPRKSRPAPTLPSPIGTSTHSGSSSENLRASSSVMVSSAIVVTPLLAIGPGHPRGANPSDGEPRK